jgi:hypothetical protein
MKTSKSLSLKCGDLKTVVRSQPACRRNSATSLKPSLGPVGMARFLQQYDSGKGDYTRERAGLMKGKDVKTIAEEIKALKKKSGVVR